MSFAILIATKPKAEEIAKDVIDYLTKKGQPIALEEPHAKKYNHVSIENSDPASIKLFIVLGGDGTILYFKQKYAHLDHVPYVGINLGFLGFLAGIKLEHAHAGLDELIEGKYTVEDRVMLDGTLQNGDTYTAVNDFVLHRGSNPKMIELKVHVGGKYLNVFRADGMIFSSPTGATAYAVAAGGPLIMPTLHNVILAPINPHTLTNRPIIVSSEDEILIEYIGKTGSIDLSIDGLTMLPFTQENSLKLKASKKKFRLAVLPRSSFFSTLRTKFQWKGHFTEQHEHQETP